ncbi:MAG: single-stranded DNA-binding protein [Candidatus Magasanikbacteria bacterium]|nr:single-stranded DNA-binding protein [Candidatus Magasanikbacteria bacterium]
MDLNRATILGRLTADPEVKTTPSGQTVATLSVATNQTWTDKSGNKQEKVQFHNCVLWGRLAEIAGQYLSKGQKIYLEGRIETRDWVGKDGVKRYRTEIVVNQMIMLGGGSRGNTNNAGNADQSTPAPIPVIQQESTSKTQQVEANDTEEIKVEDIPF